MVLLGTFGDVAFGEELDAFLTEVYSTGELLS